jgi:glucose/arabinose dehydrogenase
MKVHATRFTITVLGLALCLIAGSMLTHARVLPEGVKVERVLDNTAELGDLAQSPRGELWLLERVSGTDEGTIRVFVAGVEAATLVVPVKDDCESGLLDVAFAPDYKESGLGFLYYVDTSGEARVDEIFYNGGVLSLGSQIVDNLGTTVGGCCPGGGIEVGPDGLLYVAVGDLETSSNAQNDLSDAGKVLRVNLDGTAAAGNPWGNKIWTKGFRNGKDMDIDTDGHVYLSDVGDSGMAVGDEVNEATSGGNFGWDVWDGDDGGDPTYDDPLQFWNDPSNSYPEAVVKLTDSLGDELAGNVVYASTAFDYTRRLVLAGTTPETVDSHLPFFSPDEDEDGSPDTECPRDIHALELGNDGWLYAAANGANPGIWRFYHDTPGPREVSAVGSPFHLTVDKDVTNIKIGWEKLEDVDAHRATRYATGQPPEVYQIWEGDLPITTPNHANLVWTDGDSDGPGRLTWTGAPGPDDHYYLVSAQGDNFEGTLGNDSGGTPRSGTYDDCLDIGYSNQLGDCMEDFEHPVTNQPMGLIDYNPWSPTYMEEIRMSDFRGMVIKMDLSALDCYYCSVQAYFHFLLERNLAPRDLKIITVMHQTYGSGHPPIPPANCASEIQAWQLEHRERNPIVCDTDLDSNGTADVYEQLHAAWDGCYGTPQNFFIDQGFVLYDFWCGASTIVDPYLTTLEPECNPETCE